VATGRGKERLLDMKKNVIILVIWFLYAISCFGQQYEVPLNERIDSSAYIFEGRVLSTFSYPKPNSTIMCNSAIVQISKIFKGNLTCGTIQIVFPGEIIIKKAKEPFNIDMVQSSDENRLSLRKGAKGIFFCIKTELPERKITVTNSIGVDTYAAGQGFLGYQIINGKGVANDWGKQYNQDDLLNLIEDRLGKKYSGCTP